MSSVLKVAGFGGLLGALALFSQTVRAAELQVTLAPQEVFLGDAFELRVSADEKMEGMSATFSSSAVLVGRSQQVSIVNGEVSSALIYSYVPEAVGICRLESLEVSFKGGRQVRYEGHPELRVKEIEVDPALSIEAWAEPKDPLPGDSVEVVVEVSAEGLAYQGQTLSPFLQQDFFGQYSQRMPRLQFHSELPEEGPLQLMGRERVENVKVGDRLVWRVRYPYKAVRAGQVHFPAAIIRDSRVTAVDAEGRLRFARCAAIGHEVEVTVSDPPLEGRPAGYTGVIGHSFSVCTEVDSTNVKEGDPLVWRVIFFTDCDRSLIRAPVFDVPAGFRGYGEVSREEVTRGVADGVREGVAFSYHLRPIRAGLLELPPMSYAWFERSSRSYRTVLSDAVPIRVRPSEQVVLAETTGDSARKLPPPFRFDGWREAERGVRLWAWIVLATGGCIWFMRLGWAVIAKGVGGLVRRLARRRMGAEAVVALREAESAEAAVAAIRRWANDPALTAVGLRNYFSEMEGGQAATCFERLEHAIYRSGKNWEVARDELVALIMSHRRGRHGRRMGLWLVVCVLLPGVGFGAVDAFVREQMNALSLGAERAEDYVEVATAWLRLAEQGDDSRVILQNGAGCALLARAPAVALALTKRDVWANGWEAADGKLLQAAYAQLGEELPFFWAQGGAHVGVGRLWEGVCVGGGVLFLLLALPRRRVVKVLLGVGLVIELSVLVLAMVGSRALDEALPKQIEVMPEEVMQ